MGLVLDGKLSNFTEKSSSLLVLKNVSVEKIEFKEIILLAQCLFV
jgi:hypothetical protein